MVVRNTVSILPIALVVAVAGVFLASCSEGGGGGSPTQPSGPRLDLSADSTTISPFGSTLIAARALGAQGEALSGRTVDLTTDMGTIVLTPVVTNEEGIALSRLQGEGTEGRATVTGRLDGTQTEGQVQVLISRGAPVTIDVRPAVIAPLGSAQIFVQLRQSNGSIPPVGTQVELSTSLGRFTEPTPRTDSLGVARSRIEGRGDEGTAILRARRADTGEDATTQLEIISGFVLTLRASQTSLPVNAALTLVATVSTPSGVPAGEGTQIVFTATAGRLAASRVPTNALGAAQTQWTAPEQPATQAIRAQIAGATANAELLIVVTAE